MRKQAKNLINADMNVMMTRRRNRSVRFTEEIDVFEVECFREHLNRCWYQNDDYRDFSLDRKACVVAYRKVAAKNRQHQLSEDVQLCLLGLESSLSLDVRELSAERRAEIVHGVLLEQEAQWTGGYSDQDQIRLVSIGCSTEAVVEAIERAVFDTSDRRLPFTEKLRLGTGGTATTSIWGDQANMCSSPLIPRRQASKRLVKEPSFRATLTGKSSIRMQTSERLDLRPSLPQKKPSLRFLEALNRRDYRPQSITRQPSLRYEVSLIQ